MNDVAIDDASPRSFELPEWVDDEIFREFLSTAAFRIEEFAPQIAAYQDGDEEAFGIILGWIHSLKGEAGVIGLEEFSAACHDLETRLERPGTAVERAAVLVRAVDWFARACETYGTGFCPEPCRFDIEASAAAPDESTADAAVAAEPPPEQQPSTVDADAGHGWDEDMLDVVEEFLQEGSDDMARADELLLTIEREGADLESVNAIFRVFHSFKGVSAFLELDQITELAHATETLLNAVREGGRSLEGALLDRVFDATGLMRCLIDGLRASVEHNEPLPHNPDVRALVARLDASVAEENAGDAPKAKDSTPEPCTTQEAEPPTDAGSDLLVAQAAQTTPAPAATAPTKAASPPPSAEPAAADGRKSSKQTNKIKETVKIDLERVDSLVEMIGELVIVESMVVHSTEQSGASSPQLSTYLGQLGKITRDLQDIGMCMRMVPVRGVFQKMARMVRDLSRKTGKDIHAVLCGEATEMDRSMVEQLADPLVHMIRNAVDHGLEGADGRAAAGKSAQGTVTLSAYHQGASIVIEIRDDGRGLNREALLSKAIERGVVSSGDGMSDADVYNLIFAPGFSTAEQVTEISGRGVGMDVVRRNIEAMRGRVSISSIPGKGSTFKMILPLTLAIIDGMIISCGNERYILPTLSIVESVLPTLSMLYPIAGRGTVITIRDETLPLLRLDSLFGIEGARIDPTKAQVVIIETNSGKLGLLVDEVISQQQVVIKSLGTHHAKCQFLSGAAILSDGSVGLIVNVDELGSMSATNSSSGGGSARPHGGLTPDGTSATA